MKYTNAVIGFSVNPELKVTVKDKPGPKKSLLGADSYLSGSSGNVALALKKLGASPQLLGLVGVSDNQTLADMLLPGAVEQGGVPFTPIKILEATNLCIVPIIENENEVLWGKRNEIVRSAIPKALQQLSRLEIGMGRKTFTVITGLRVNEVALAEALLLKTQIGFRVLSANHSLLCAQQEIKKVLPMVDLLVLNKAGFEATGLSLTEMHSCGPRIIVVTQDKEGGTFSFPSHQTHWYNSVSFQGGHFETGAGDWFLGALVSEMIHLGVTASTVTPEQFQQVVNFAAKVAGKKITMPGGGNGPSRRQLH